MAFSQLTLAIVLINLFSTMFESFTNVEFLERISRKQENDRELEETLVNHFITVLQNDIKKNEHRITVDDKIPSELIFTFTVLHCMVLCLGKMITIWICHHMN